jgi:hypothetical protein
MLAVEHGRFTREGESEEGNAVFEQLTKALESLVAAGEDHLLVNLFDDADPWVQLWAATHSPEIAEDQALEKLRSLQAVKIPLTSMSAKYTIQSWSEGLLHFRIRSQP